MHVVLEAELLPPPDRRDPVERHPAIRIVRRARDHPGALQLTQGPAGRGLADGERGRRLRDGDGAVPGQTAQEAELGDGDGGAGCQLSGPMKAWGGRHPQELRQSPLDAFDAADRAIGRFRRHIIVH